MIQQTIGIGRCPNGLQIAASAGCVLIVSCTQPHDQGTQLSASHALSHACSPSLSVLRIHSDYGTLSGFAVSPTLVVTAAHGLKKGHEIVAVEGEPMHVLRTGDFRDRIRQSPEETPVTDDWVLLHAQHVRLQPDPIDAEIELHEGDRVIIAGYPIQEQSPTDLEFCSMPARAVEGHVANQKFLIPEHRGLVPIAVPWGEYHGFSGGPVASVDPNGKVIVWGVAVHLWWDWRPWKLQMWLLAARLPTEEIKRAQSSYCCDPTDDPLASLRSLTSKPAK